METLASLAPSSVLRGVGGVEAHWKARARIHLMPFTKSYSEPPLPLFKNRIHLLQPPEQAGSCACLCLLGYHLRFSEGHNIISNHTGIIIHNSNCFPFLFASNPGAVAGPASQPSN